MKAVDMAPVAAARQRHSDLPDYWPGREHSHRLSIDGRRWHLLTTRPAPPEPGQSILLMLHGTGASSHSWVAVAEQLTTDLPIIMPDLPGHFLTETFGPRDLCLRGMTRALDDLLVTKDWRPDIIIGHSAGAAIALSLGRVWAEQHQRPPRHIVSVAGALTPYGGALAPLFGTIAKLVSKAPGLKMLAALRAQNKTAIQRMVERTGSTIDPLSLRCLSHLLSNRQHISHVLTMMGYWDLTPLNKNPTLPFPFSAIEMTGDLALPKGQADAFLAATPDAQLRCVDGLGHLGHEEDPARIAQILNEILSS